MRYCKRADVNEKWHLIRIKSVFALAEEANCSQTSAGTVMLLCSPEAYVIPGRTDKVKETSEHQKFYCIKEWRVHVHAYTYICMHTGKRESWPRQPLLLRHPIHNWFPAIKICALEPFWKLCHHNERTAWSCTVKAIRAEHRLHSWQLKVEIGILKIEVKTWLDHSALVLDAAGAKLCSQISPNTMSQSTWRHKKRRNQRVWWFELRIE